MKNVITVLNPFTLESDAHSLSHGISFVDESLTVQADAAQADINQIVKQFGLTQELPYGNAVPSYDDFSDFPTDYHQAMNYIKASDDLFMQYPADVRSRFSNDAGNFLHFLSNSENRDEAIALGFIDAPAEQASADAAEAGAKPSAQDKPEA